MSIINDWSLKNMQIIEHLESVGVLGFIEERCLKEEA